MGSLNAMAMAEVVGEGEISLRTALGWHLSSNHYPPVPESMIEPCVLAIEAAGDEDWNRQIDLPEGVTWRGETSAPAHAIIEGHHLDSFLTTEEDV